MKEKSPGKKPEDSERTIVVYNGRIVKFRLPKPEEITEADLNKSDEGFDVYA